MAYTAVLNDKTVVLKTPLPNTNHAAVAANDLEVRVKRRRLSKRFAAMFDRSCCRGSFLG